MTSFLAYLFEASVCLFFSFSLYKLFLEKLTFFSWNRFFLIFITLGSCLFPLISLNPDTFNNNQAVSAIAENFYRLDQVMLLGAAETRGTFSLITLILYLYWTVFILLSGKLLLQLISIYHLIKKSETTKKNEYTLVINNRLQFSSFLWFIFLPEKYAENQDHDSILIHESIHVKQGHTYDLLFFKLLCIFFWFNPFSHLLAKAIEEVHEFLADREVAKTYSPLAYSRMILNMIDQENNFTLFHNFYNVQLKNRIMMLNKEKSPRKKRTRFLLAIPLVGLMFMLFSFDYYSNNNQADKLIGSWQGASFEYKHLEGNTIEAMIEGGRAMHKSGTLILRKNNTYEIKNTDPNVRGNGTWSLEKDSILKTIDSNGNVTEYTISSVTDNQLVTTHQVNTKTPEGSTKGIITLSYTR